MQIPQISRDRLASSLVGTPGTDTSGQKIGAAIADVVGPLAIQRQDMLDETETNKLSVDYKMKSANDLEVLKAQYRDDPEKVAPLFMTALRENRDTIQRQASNPRVSLMFGKGDPYFDTHLIMSQQGWAYGERDRLNTADITNRGNTLANTAEEIGRNAKSPEEIMSGLVPLASATGNLLNEARASVSPAAAEKLNERMLPTMYSRAMYGALNTNPRLTLAMTDNDEVQKAFASNPKELESIRVHAEGRVKELDHIAVVQQKTSQLQQFPDIVKSFSTGNPDWNKIQAFPEGHLKTELEKMATSWQKQDAIGAGHAAPEGVKESTSEGIDITPKLEKASAVAAAHQAVVDAKAAKLYEASPLRQQQKDKALAQFYADAADLGANVKGGQLTGNLDQLIKFNTELAKARNEKVITNGEYASMLDKLTVPLRDAVLSAHDPSQKELTPQKSGGIFGLFQHEEPPTATVDKYTGGYTVINDYLKSQGKDQDWTTKVQMVQKYMEMSDKVRPEDRDFEGRPWNPQSLARSAAGILKGRDTLPTPLGPRPIDGYNTKTGLPYTKITDEDAARLNQLKNLPK